MTLKEVAEDPNYVLKLIPKKKKFDLSVIYLSISPKTFDVVQIVTYNQFEDETRIELKNFMFEQTLSDALFKLDIPKGADVIKLDQ